MSTSFPSSLQDLDATRGTTGQPLSSRNHITHHQIEDDTIEALQAKVGVDNSAVTTSLDYLVKSTSSTSPGHKHNASDIIGGGVVPTGTVMPYAGSSAPSLYLLCDGSAVSRTTYATLFGVISTTYGIGDGSSTFNLPDLRSRIPVGAGTGTKVATFSSRSSNVITVTGLSNVANNEFQTGQAVLYATTGSVMTGLTNNTTYYIVRVSNTTFSLASSLANAQNGTVISLSSDGAGTQTFTLTLTARTSGDTGGEENHAMSSTELLSHTHGINYQPANFTGGGALTTSNLGNSGTFVSDPYHTISATGGNASMNNMQPFVAMNYIIKT